MEYLEPTDPSSIATISEENIPIENLLRICAHDLHLSQEVLNQQLCICQQEQVHTLFSLKMIMKTKYWEQSKLLNVVKARLEEFFDTTSDERSDKKRKAGNTHFGVSLNKTHSGESFLHRDVKVSISPSGIVKETIHDKNKTWEPFSVTFLGYPCKTVVAVLEDTTSKEKKKVQKPIVDDVANFSFLDFHFDTLMSGRLYVLQIQLTEVVQEPVVSMPIVFLKNVNQKEKAFLHIFNWKRLSRGLDAALSEFYFTKLNVSLQEESLRYLKHRFSNEAAIQTTWSWLYCFVQNLFDISKSPLWKKQQYLLRSTYIMDDMSARSTLKLPGDFILRACTNIEELNKNRPLCVTYMLESGFQKVAFSTEECKTGVFMQKNDLQFMMVMDENGNRNRMTMTMVAPSGPYGLASALKPRESMDDYLYMAPVLTFPEDMQTDEDELNQ